MILHIDMDCFFAQVEERENPRFRGIPLIIGSDPKDGSGRGVVSTSNYEARKFGIYSGMPISKAYKANKEAIFLPVNQNLYQKTSQRIFKIIELFSKDYQPVSLDEAYLDIKKIAKNYSEARKVAEKLKELILRKENLTCSVGVAQNKMIAKIASESDKPNGLVVVKPKDSFKFISEKKIKEIPGIGPKTELQLEELLQKKNLKVKDVRALSENQLNSLGKKGSDIYQKVRGIDGSSIELKRKPKSVGKEKTFEEDTSDSKKIIETFKKLTKEVFLISEKEKLDIEKITVICRFDNFKTITKQISFFAQKLDEGFIYKKGVKLLLRILTKNYRPIRLIGIRVSFKKNPDEL